MKLKGLLTQNIFVAVVRVCVNWPLIQIQNSQNEILPKYISTEKVSEDTSVKTSEYASTSQQHCKSQVSPIDEGENRGKGDREKGMGERRKGGRKEKKDGRKEIKGENEETKE